MPSIRLSMIKTKQQWLRWTTQRAHDVLGSQDWYNDHCSRQPIPSLSCLARPTIWQCQWIPTWLRFRTFIAAFKITPIGTRTWRFLTKYFLVVLINSLTLVKYGKIVPQFLENIKTLSMCLVSAFIPLKAVSMASDKARFKDVYAAKTDKFKKTEWERVWMNCVVYILTAVIRTLPVSNKRTWALWTPQVRQSQMKRWISLQTMMSHIQAKPDTKTHAHPTSKTDTAWFTSDSASDNAFFTYSAYGASTQISPNDSSQFLLDTGSVTYIAQEQFLFHDIKMINPVYITDIAGKNGRVNSIQSCTTNVG